MFSPLSLPSSSSVSSLARSKSKRGTNPISTSQQVADVNPVARSAVSFEYASLLAKLHCPLGVYVVPSVETIMVWDAVLFVHQGYYSDAVLKFRLSFPSNYPEKPPAVTFITDVFHPLISSDGAFNITPQIRTWRPGQHHVFDVLHFVKAAFKSHVLEKLEEADCFNREAYRFHDSTPSFVALASQSASLSKSTSSLFDMDQPTMTAKPSHGMRFTDLDLKVLREERAKYGLKSWEGETAN
ncbi:ubiquitin-conjugating enzyme domain-containing protein [Moniliophthora roreri MCA 2997]|uniref:Ubiquitin-conjugating enzyme domain-containing protein n=2 Tax=Moniliophthora roreri TaxID=221103 RepID=V2XT00_MONRO|nr:ubiquitin-conjugating enzyme domain-containing protein [Moniliophthora roreri MCA 2997]